MKRQDADLRRICLRWHYRPERLATLDYAILCKRLKEITGAVPQLSEEQVRRAARGFAARHALPDDRPR